ITRVTSSIIGFMIPAILAEMIVLSRISKLDGSGTNISKLMEASMSRSLYCTITTYFSTGKTPSAADLYLHITAIGNSQQLPGLTIPSTRVLDIATNCTEINNENNCVKRKREIKNNEKVLKVYLNASDSLVTWQSDDRIYLIQSPPLEKTYSYFGSGVFLQPSYIPISSICNLKARYGAMTNYSCPKEFWYASGNTITQSFNVNITEGMHGPGPLHAIVTIRYAKELSTNYDSEFVAEVHVLKAFSLSNLTNSQFFTLDQASTSYKMVSTLLANAFTQKWAQATIASFSGIDLTIVSLAAILIYATVIILPLIIFSCRLLYQAIIKEHYADDDCLKNLAMQERIIENIECNIKTDEGHIEL
ncbi:15848_t:CDS:2, partial [Funneliformis caledonium]